MSRRALLAAALLAALAPSPLARAQAPVATVTFEEAVQRAIAQSPTVGEAAQAVRRAEALLDQARAVFFPSLDGLVGTTVIDKERGFGGNVTQPRRQSSFGATLSYSVLAASRWAEKAQAADRVGIARLSAEETRQQVALTAAQSYLAVLTGKRLVGIAVRNRDTAAALAEYARVRLDAGQGSRLNYVRSAQELSANEGRVQVAELALRRAQEALGVAIFAEGPVDAAGDASLAPAALPPSGEAWLTRRPDVRVSTAEVAAADRVARDVWKSWLPSLGTAFTPQYVTPPGFFAPAATWQAVFQLQIPIYDGTLGATRRLRNAERESAQLRLDALKVQARSELRITQEAVRRNEEIVETARRSAENAAEALRITEIAYRAGATTNVEVVQAQQTARNAELELALAEDRLRQARLDLLVALGQFP
jgi:outer membrane protein